jgi:hypothetical protein
MMTTTESTAVSHLGGEPLADRAANPRGSG